LQTEGDQALDYTAGAIKDTEFFTTAELAKKLKMNVQVITRKVQAGEILAYKIGKEWRIPEQSVFQWLQTHINTKKNGKKDKLVATFTNEDKVVELPAQRSKRKYLLEYILAQFEPNRLYSDCPVRAQQALQRGGSQPHYQSSSRGFLHRSSRVLG